MSNSTYLALCKVMPIPMVKYGSNGWWKEKEDRSSKVGAHKKTLSWKYCIYPTIRWHAPRGRGRPRGWGAEYADLLNPFTAYRRQFRKQSSGSVWSSHSNWRDSEFVIICGRRLEALWGRSLTSWRNGEMTWGHDDGSPVWRRRHFVLVSLSEAEIFLVNFEKIQHEESDTFPVTDGLHRDYCRKLLYPLTNKDYCTTALSYRKQRLLHNCTLLSQTNVVIRTTQPFMKMSVYNNALYFSTHLSLSNRTRSFDGRNTEPVTVTSHNSPSPSLLFRRVTCVTL
jgi:hypothetical protein